MEYIGIRRFYIDELELKAKVLIELRSKDSKERYFMQLICD